MLSVITPTFNSAPDLARLLPSLVPAAVDGLVREVIFADGGSADATAEIAEDAGARMVSGGLVAAGREARSERLLLVPADLVLDTDWMPRMAKRLAAGGAAGRLRGTGAGSVLAVLAQRPFALLCERRWLEGRPECRNVPALGRPRDCPWI